MTGATATAKPAVPRRARGTWAWVWRWTLPLWVVACVAALTHGASLWVIPRIVNAPILDFASAAAVQGVWRPPSLGAISSANPARSTDGPSAPVDAIATQIPPSQAAPWADPGALLAICPVDLQRQPVLHVRWLTPPLKAPGHWQVRVLDEDGQTVLSQASPDAPSAGAPRSWWVYARSAVGAMAPEGAQPVQLRQARALVAVRVWPAVGDMASARLALQALRCSSGSDDDPAR